MTCLLVKSQTVFYSAECLDLHLLYIMCVERLISNNLDTDVLHRIDFKKRLSLFLSIFKLGFLFFLLISKFSELLDCLAVLYIGRISIRFWLHSSVRLDICGLLTVRSFLCLSCHSTVSCQPSGGLRIVLNTFQEDTTNRVEHYLSFLYQR